MFEYDAHAREAPNDDGLFLERLDTFMEKSLGEIKAFAERERRPYEETRRCIAQWHAKYLFQSSTGPSGSNRSSQIQSTLRDASRMLETFADISGIQSFLLAIDPSDSSDGGFLGGSLIGREFWRGMRGGGDTGARAFKSFYATQSQTIAKGSHKQAVERHVPTPPPPKVRLPSDTPAKLLKNEVYESVRTALRLASGIQTAEMKWTNPEKLDIFGVCLVGWPEGVPAQNPSTLKAGQNRLLHEAIQNGTMRFEKLPGRQPSGSGGCGVKEDNGDVDDFSWAYDVDARPSSPPPTAPLRTQSPVQTSVMATNPTPLDISDLAQTTWVLDPPAEAETSLASYSIDDPWEHEFSEGMMDNLDTEWMCELQLERPRKRQRSEEPGSGADHVLK